MKKSKISYNTYYNERLKKVEFHGVETYPLYVTINHKGKSIFFKSYCFELFAASRYGRSKKEQEKVPTLENVIKCENKLLELMVDELGDNLILKDFKSYYDINCKDLCTHTADGFLVYMFLFFSQNKASNFGNALSIGCNDLILYNVLEEMKTILNDDLYEKLIAGSIINKQPYLPIHKYALTRIDFPLPYFPIISWKDEQIKKQFIGFLNSNYTEAELTIINKDIRGWIGKLV